VTEPTAHAAPKASDEALIGRDKLMRNVMSGWASHAITIVAGFIVPRLIDTKLGPELLGIWDFGWALTACATLLPGGSTSGIDRYVAALRAVGDEAGINRAVSSITAVLGAMAVLTITLGALAAYALPWAFQNQLGSHVLEAQWVVVLLSASIAIDIGLAGYGGVLSGFHRFDLFHGIDGVRGALITAGYIAVLVLGGGIIELAAVNALGILLGRTARAIAAHRVFPPLSVRWRQVSRATAFEMTRFGSKAFAPQLGDVLLAQANMLVIMAALGPASVAVFARSRALIRTARVIVNRHAFVIIPTASALHAMDRRDELRRQLIDSTRVGLFIALPFFFTFTILGGQLLQVWMGPSYEQAALLALLAVGYFFVMATQPAMSILTGMNQHGRAGFARVLAAVAAISGTCIALGPLDGGLTAVGVAISVPLIAVDGIYLPMLVCRRLDIPIARFVRESACRPILCVLPLALSFAAARGFYADRAWLALASGGLGALLLSGPLYWRYAVRDATSGLFPRDAEAGRISSEQRSQADRDSGDQQL
jgi:O-antigen/teichoic acid export membrane protein